jgi:hypothetical protein
MMEAASTSETSATFYHITGRNIPEDSHLNTRRRKNLKSHKAFVKLQRHKLLISAQNRRMRHRAVTIQSRYRSQNFRLNR